MQQLYQQLILEHAKVPVGRVNSIPPLGVAGANEQVGKSHQANPTCGDEITLIAKIGDDKITEIVWEGQGCSISQASASVMTEAALGHTLTEIAVNDAKFHELMNSRGKGLALEADMDLLGDAVAFTGVSQYPARIKCALLGWEALKAAILNAATD